MKTFASNIISKLERYSEKLNNLTLLVNQHWVLLDEFSNQKKVFIFRKSDELLIVVNGIVEKANWEYVGLNSILIDSKDQSLLFRHGFFDENILALKIDSTEEYAILVNESKYSGELNNLSAITSFLENKYLINKEFDKNPIDRKPQKKFIDIRFLKNGNTWKMGSFKVFLVTFDNGDTIEINQRKSDLKYFYYYNKEILLFQNQKSCIEYIEKRID